MAAERIQPALSSIGVGRGGAQVLQPIDPRQEVRPNQVVEDYKKRLDEQLDARNAQRKKAQEALSDIEAGTLPSFNTAIQNRTQEVMVKRGEDPEVFLNEVEQLQKDAARIKAQENLLLENIKTGKLNDVYIKDTDGKVKPFLESEKYFSTVSGEGFELDMNFGDEVLSMLTDPRQVLKAPSTTPEKYAVNLFSEIAKNYGMTEELDRINKRVGAGEDFAEVIKTSDIPPEVYENFEKRLAEDNTFKEIYDKSIMLRENMTPAEFLVSQGTEESPNYADYVAGKASFIEEIVPSKRKVTSSVSRIPEGKKDRGGFSDEDLQIAKDVKRDVNAFQDTGDATDINKYLAPYGVYAQVDKGANTAQFYREKVSAAGKKSIEPVTQPIKLDDAEGLYNVVSRVDRNIKREAIDLVEFEDPTVGTQTDETLKADITKIMKDKEEEVLDKFEGVEVERNFFDPDILKVDGREFNLDKEEEAKAAFEYLETRGYGKKKSNKSEPKFVAPNGVAYTKQQLLGAGWNESQINGLKRQ